MNRDVGPTGAPVSPRNVVSGPAEKAASHQAMAWDVKERAKDGIERLARQGLDLVTFWARRPSPSPGPFLITARPVGSTSILRHCWLPATSTRGSRRSPRNGSRRSIARTTSTISLRSPGPRTLHEATGGGLSRSPRWNAFIHPYGGEQELLVACEPTPAWGMLPLPRAGPARVRPGRDGLPQGRLLVSGGGCSPRAAPGGGDGPGGAGCSGPGGPGRGLECGFGHAGHRPLALGARGRPGGSGQTTPRCSPSPAARFERRSTRTHRVRLRSHGCFRRPVVGWPSTAPHSSPTASGGWR